MTCKHGVAASPFCECAICFFEEVKKDPGSFKDMSGFCKKHNVPYEYPHISCYMCREELSEKISMSGCVPSCKHGISKPLSCIACDEDKKMSGCHVPLSEKEMHDNSLYTKMIELEIENKNLHTKIERLKDLLSEMVYKL